MHSTLIRLEPQTYPRLYSIGAVRTIKTPESTSQFLTATSKMPGPSFSLPAHRSCGYAWGDICKNCYAEKGCYAWESTEQAQEFRFAFTREAMKSLAGRQKWVTYMVAAIHKTKTEYFRVHDSGDMFSAAYAECWYEVACQLPLVKFWIPTRVWQSQGNPLPASHPILSVLRRLAQLPNVTVRPSALNFGDKAPQVEGLHAGSTAAMPDVFRAFQCGAYTRDGHCGDCRACWDDKFTPVSYPAH